MMVPVHHAAIGRNHYLYTQDHLKSTYLDTGAQCLVMRLNQARVHANFTGHTGHRLRLNLSSTIFTVVDGTIQSLDAVNIRFPAEGGSFLRINVDIVGAGA